MLGWVAVPIAIYERATDPDGLTAGDGARVTIALLSATFPAFGLAYALVDLTVQFSTGTSMTDRIATDVDAFAY